MHCCGANVVNDEDDNLISKELAVTALGGTTLATTVLISRRMESIDVNTGSSIS
jgi:hypothetical protein